MNIKALKSKATGQSGDNISLRSTRKGLALVAVVVCVLIFTILGLSILSMVNNEIILAQGVVNKNKAFYLAEAGVEVFSAKLNKGQSANIGETALGEGSYRVDFYSAADPPYAIATGEAGGQEKRIKVTATFLAPPYECGIYAGGLSGEDWTLMLRGIGNPVSKSGGEVGGKDIINGNIFVDGDVALYQESSVKPATAPNKYNLKGDVEATGDVNLYDSASVSGTISEGVEPYVTPDLVGMNYAVNNTHNVGQIFADEGVTQGYLPVGNPLRDIFVKNPNDRSSECSSTTGDDYFLEPVNVPGGGTYKDSTTPLHLGNDRVYYVDGDVWVHSKPTYGFIMDGKVTIVATGNIHISDNLQYKDSSSMLGLVALGKYDEDGKLVSGGNIYFGDPRYGTTYVVSGMMFAANNFLYNTDAIGRSTAEPESGFIVNGSFAALNDVSVERDWYTRSDGTPRPARYDLATKNWIDSETGAVLTSTEIGTLRHYQMIVNYDDRVRTQDTQPPGLPKGKGTIFAGLKKWEELP
jgi:roadblock/LC7 domain-containing protein